LPNHDTSPYIPRREIDPNNNANTENNRPHVICVFVPALPPPVPVAFPAVVGEPEPLEPPAAVVC